MGVFRLVPALVAGVWLCAGARLAQAQLGDYGRIELEISTTDEQPVEARAYGFGAEGRVQIFRIRGEVATRQASRFLVPGTYEVEVWAEGYRPLRISGIQVKAGESVPVKARLRRGMEVEEVGALAVTKEELANGSLEGYVRDEKGAVLKFNLVGAAQNEPPGGVGRYVRLLATPSTAYSTSSNGGGDNEGKSGFSVTMDHYMGGCYKVRYLQPGTYDLTVTGEEYHGTQKLRGVEIRAGVRTLLDITLTRGMDVEIAKPAVRRKSLVPSS